MLAAYKYYRSNQINKKAECLYNVIGKEPGFDIWKAVKDLGGEVVHDVNKQLPSGVDAKIYTFLEGEDISFKIICAKNKSDIYTRFCVAHELGHLFLHMLEKDVDGNIRIIEESFNKDVNNSNLREWEAEEFAACFLMPEEEFKSYIERLQGDVEKVAQVFKVSSQSVVMRCKRLEILQ